MEGGGRDVDCVAGVYLECFVIVQHLFARAGDDVEDFFGFGVVVAIVAFAGEEDDFAEGEGGILGLIGADESLDRTPIKGVSVCCSGLSAASLSSCWYLFELLHVLRHGDFGWQPLHARSPKEPHYATRPLQHVGRVVGAGDWTAVTED